MTVRDVKAAGRGPEPDARRPRTGPNGLREAQGGATSAAGGSWPTLGLSLPLPHSCLSHSHFTLREMLLGQSIIML